MFIFVILSLFSAWIWVDASEEINSGLSFNQNQFEFLDLDLDGDEDMLREGGKEGEPFTAFENIFTTTGRRWKENSDLLEGLYWGGHSFGAGDINNDGRKEIVISIEDNWHKSMIAFVNKGEPGSPFWELDTTLFNYQEATSPDFADIDGDGDLDMLGDIGGEWNCKTVLWWNHGTPQKPSWELDTTYFQYSPGGPTPPTPLWIDWEKDGIWDILVAEWTWCDPPPCYGYISVRRNLGSAIEPVWEEERVLYLLQTWQMEVLDWNQDGVEDLLLSGDEWFSSYRLLIGEQAEDGISFKSPPLVWGGIEANYPAAADLDADGVPELAISQIEFQIDIWGIGWYFPYFRYYSSVNQEGTLWQLDRSESYCDYAYSYNGHLQYVDFDNDGLTDYIENIAQGDIWSGFTDGKHTLYRNQGTKTQPVWPDEGEILNDLPILFPSCFLDADGDGDKDVIGFSWEDSILVGFLNVGSDQHPNYMKYDALSSGLEGINPTYLAAGDITDNDLDLPDLAIGIKDGELTAYFNSGQDNPRWHKHEEVFKSLGVNGNPALRDADGDEDLDLYLVTAGRLHYYRNESTGGVSDENSPARLSSVTIAYIGDEVEISLTSGKPSDEAKLLLYNTAGQRVVQDSRQPQEGMVRFRILQPPGVYFYRVSSGGQNFKGKIVLY